MKQEQKNLELVINESNKTQIKPIKIAFLGEVGVGKTSAINLLLGEDVSETVDIDPTTEILTYKLNDDKQRYIEVVDIPGYGNINYNFNDFFENFMASKNFDLVFLFVNTGNTKEDDARFALSLIKKGINVRLVFSKSEQIINISDIEKRILKKVKSTEDIKKITLGEFERLKQLVLNQCSKRFKNVGMEDNIISQLITNSVFIAPENSKYKLLNFPYENRIKTIEHLKTAIIQEAKLVYMQRARMLLNNPSQNVQELVNSAVIDGDTLFHIAVSTNDTTFIKQLLEFGASILIPNTSNKTAYDLAPPELKLQIKQYFTEKITQAPTTALRVAIASRCTSIINELPIDTTDIKNHYLEILKSQYSQQNLETLKTFFNNSLSSMIYFVVNSDDRIMSIDNLAKKPAYSIISPTEIFYRAIFTNEWLDDTQIQTLATTLGFTTNEIPNTQFVVCSDIISEENWSHLSESIENFRLDQNPLKKFAAVVNVNQNHWCSLYIIPSADSAIIVYNDSFGSEKIPQKILDVVSAHYIMGKTISFKGKEQFEEFYCGLFAVSNLHQAAVEYAIRLNNEIYREFSIMQEEKDKAKTLFGREVIIGSYFDRKKALFDAVSRNDEKTCLDLIRSGLNPHELVDDEGRSILDIATSLENNNLIRLLNGMPLIHAACISSNKTKILDLIKKGHSILTKFNNKTPLQAITNIVLINELREELKPLLKDYIKDQDKNDYSEELIKFGVPLDAADIEYLKKNNEGLYLKFVIESERRQELEKSKTSKRRYSLNKDVLGTFFIRAKEGKYKEILGSEKLKSKKGYINLSLDELENGSDVTSGTEKLIHIAATNADFDTIKKMLELGADISILDEKKRNVFHLLAWRKEEKGTNQISEILNIMSNYILQQNVEGSQQQKDEQIRKNKDKLIKLLNAKDVFGMTPLDYAVSEANIEAIEAILKMLINNKPAHINTYDYVNIYHAHKRELSEIKEIIAKTVSVVLNAGKKKTERTNETIDRLHNGILDACNKMCNDAKEAGDFKKLVDALESLSSKVSQYVDSYDDNVIEAAKKISGSILDQKRENDDMTLIHLAAESNNFNLVSELIKFGCDVNIKGKNGLRPLHLACINGNYEAAQALIDAIFENKKNIDEICTTDGCTALHYAVRYCPTDINSSYYNIILHLLNNNASLQKEDKYGRTPLFYAVINKNHLVANLILQELEKIKSLDSLNTIDREGKGILEHAVMQKNDILACNLLPYTDIFKKKLNKKNILHHIAISGCFDKNSDQSILKQVLEKINNDKTFINQRDELGRTPLHYAAVNGYLDIIDIIKDHSNILEFDINNKTPLHYLLENKSIPSNEKLTMLKKFVKANSKCLEEKKNNGISCLDYIMMYDSELASRIPELLEDKDIEDSIKQVLKNAISMLSKSSNDSALKTIVAVKNYVLFISASLQKVKSTNEPEKYISELFGFAPNQAFDKNYNILQFLTIKDNLYAVSLILQNISNNEERENVIINSNLIFIAAQNDSKKMLTYLMDNFTKIDIFSSKIVLNDNKAVSAFDIATLESKKFMINYYYKVGKVNELVKNALLFSNLEAIKLAFDYLSEESKIELIIEAIKQNKTEAVKELIEKCIDLNYTENKKPKLSLLHYVAIYSNADNLRLLIKKGADVNKADSNGLTPLVYAVIRNFVSSTRTDSVAQAKAIEKLAKKGKSSIIEFINKQVSYQSTDIESQQCIETLLLANANTIIVDEIKNESIKGILEKATKVNTLINAVKNADQSIIESLNNSIEVSSVVDFEGNNLLYHAVLTENHEFLQSFYNKFKELVANNQDVLRKLLNARDIKGNTLIFYALESKDSNILTVLLNTNLIDLNVYNAKGETPLYLAVIDDFKSKEIISLFLSKGANPNKLVLKNTILHYALLRSHKETKGKEERLDDYSVAEIIVQNGGFSFNPETIDKGIGGTQKTQLMIAIEKEDYRLANILIDAGTNIHIIDIEGKNALSYANYPYRNNLELRRRLVESGSQDLGVKYIKDWGIFSRAYVEETAVLVAQKAGEATLGALVLVANTFCNRIVDKAVDAAKTRGDEVGELLVNSIGLSKSLKSSDESKSTDNLSSISQISMSGSNLKLSSKLSIDQALYIKADDYGYKNIRRVQQTLLISGNWIGKGTKIDGIWGPDTRRSLVYLQKSVMKCLNGDLGLPDWYKDYEDPPEFCGIGPQTAKKLSELYEKHFVKSNSGTETLVMNTFVFDGVLSLHQKKYVPLGTYVEKLGGKITSKDFEGMLVNGINIEFPWSPITYNIKDFYISESNRAMASITEVELLSSLEPLVTNGTKNANYKIIDPFYKEESVFSSEITKYIKKGDLNIDVKEAFELIENIFGAYKKSYDLINGNLKIEKRGDTVKLFLKAPNGSHKHVSTHKIKLLANKSENYITKLLNKAKVIKQVSIAISLIGTGVNLLERIEKEEKRLGRPLTNKEIAHEIVSCVDTQVAVETIFGIIGGAVATILAPELPLVSTICGGLVGIAAGWGYSKVVDKKSVEQSIVNMFDKLFLGKEVYIAKGMN